MTVNDDPHEQTTDYHALLGVSPEATSEELRAAYLKKVKEHPPDRAPEEFEKIRDAYNYLKDPKIRAKMMLTAVDPTTPLTSLLPPFGQKRQYVGPGPWLAALKDLSKRPNSKK